MLLRVSAKTSSGTNPVNSPNPVNPVKDQSATTSVLSDTEFTIRAKSLHQQNRQRPVSWGNDIIKVVDLASTAQGNALHPGKEAAIV